jgi:hypothetical protein
MTLNNPDLNPIEMIWAIIKARVKKLAPQTKAELEKVIAEVWEELDQKLLNRLLTGFIPRLEMLIKARGRGISPYLSSHRSETMAEDAAANPNLPLFTPEDDEAILVLANRIGNRWRRVYEILEPDFGLRQRTEVRLRAKWLTDRHENLQRPALRPPESMSRESPLDAGKFVRGWAFQGESV